MSRRSIPLRRTQQGLTLVALLVGIALGLLVVAVGSTALMTSRNIAGTVNDATSLQQQAAYAFDVIGRQIRQSGSIELSLDPDIDLGGSSGLFAALQPVAFDPPNTPVFDRGKATVSAGDGQSFTVAYQNYGEGLTSGLSQLRDCLGQNPGNSDPTKTPDELASTFRLNAGTSELVCAGTNARDITSPPTAQPVIGNVTDLRLRYAIQPPRSAAIQYVDDVDDVDWAQVVAIEVCLELTGSESISGLDGQTYQNCSDQQANYDNRLKMMFRNLFQIRSRS